MADYIDKKEMLLEIVDYRTKVQEAKEAGLEKPPVPNSLMKKFMLIVNGIARRPNFSGYSFLDEMKSRASYICFRKADSFNPEKSDNPFGYYSRIIWQEFVNVIKEEEDESYVKAKSFYNHEMSYVALEQDDDVDLTVEGFSVPYFDVDYYEQRRGIIPASQKQKTKKRRKPVADSPISALVEEQEIVCSELDSVEKFTVTE